MILTTAAGRSARFDPATHVPALEACERVRVFREAGWGVVTGFSGPDLVVHAHADRESDILSSFGRAGLVLDGDALAPMSPEERKAYAERERSDWESPRMTLPGY